MMRRVLNIAVAGVGLVVSAPIIAIMAIAIRAETPGNPMFCQKRVGKDERVFTCYKLRTMFAGTPDAASHLTSVAQVTKAGNFLRKTKLDELPQLWNVLVGDMDIVGPRPCLPVQQELIEARRAQGVFDVRPGITGLAQVQGVDMSEPERLAKLDRQYIDEASFGTDLAICWATVRGSGYGDRTA